MSVHLSPDVRVGVLYYPAATNADAIEVFAKQLFSAGYDHAIIPTAPDTAGTQANIVAFDPKPGDIFAVHTGDGGYQTAVHAIINLSLPNLVIPLPGGKANDNAVSYYKNVSFFDILANGQPARMHPLDIYVDTPGMSARTWRAVGYAGLNGTAAAARALEPIRGEVRGLREEGREFAAKTREALTSLGAVVSVPPIIAEYEGRERRAADVTFCRIRRMAREVRVHADPFSSAYFRRIVTPPGGRAGISARMLRGRFGMLFGDKIFGDTEVVVHSETGDSIPLHIDGEIALQGLMLEVASGSKVGASIAAEHINTLRLPE